MMPWLTVVDPGFHQGWSANSPGGVPTYDFAKVLQTLHEIERIWTSGGPSRPLRPATGLVMSFLPMLI